MPFRGDHMEQDLKDTLKELNESLLSNTIQLARLDERQKQTNEKVDALVINLTNNVVSPFEFGSLKQSFSDLKASHGLENQRLWIKIETMEKERQDDRTWFIRLTLGGAFTAIISVIVFYLKIKDVI